jgi:hypothetical protein
MTTNAIGSPSSASSLSVRHWWNRILLLLLITGVLNITFVHQHETQHGQNLLIHHVFPDFLMQRNTTKWIRRIVDNESETGYHQEEASDVHRVAGLSCEKYGGPLDEIAAEMVYWSDIPSDAAFVSPLQKAGPKVKYLTFEPGNFSHNDRYYSEWKLKRSLLSIYVRYGWI